MRRVQKIINKHAEKAKSDAEIAIKYAIEKLGDPSLVDLSNSEVSISNIQIEKNIWLLPLLADIYGVEYAMHIIVGKIRFGPKSPTKEEKKAEILEQISELKIDMDNLQNALNDLNDESSDDSDSD